MKVLCYMENGTPSVHEISSIYYFNGDIVMDIAGSTYALRSKCEDMEYYNFLVNGLMTSNKTSINNNYMFHYDINT